MATQTASFLIEGAHQGRYPALDDAVRSMVTSSLVLGRYRIDMPLLMPSGSMTTVTVWPEGQGETFMVTDDGAALFEIESGAFAERIFQRVAKERCPKYGAVFDNAAMFFLRVTPDHLRGAIIAMANLMKEVVDETIQRSVAQKAKQIDEELWDKLNRTFSGFEMERRAHVLGESTAEHEFTALLKTERGLIVFDTFSAQGNSINSVYVKMSDIRRTDDAPRGVAVTRRTSDIGPKLNLITSVSQVVELGIETDALRRLALAA